jgi:hypothetical protein
MAVMRNPELANQQHNSRNNPPLRCIDIERIPQIRFAKVAANVRQAALPFRSAGDLIRTGSEVLMDGVLIRFGHPGN